MCFDSVSYMLLQDERFMELVANPELDLVHKQVIMALYSLEASHQLDDYRETLPVYLSMDWNTCSQILDVIERVGLISRNDTGITLVHRFEMPDPHASSCGCH
jgi:hypothetical protein